MDRKPPVDAGAHLAGAVECLDAATTVPEIDHARYLVARGQVHATIAVALELGRLIESRPA